MSGTMQKYVMPALQMVGGGAMTAMGMPSAGVPMMASGGTGLIAGATGNPAGSPGPAGFAPPSGTSMGDIGAALQGNPLLKGISPSQVTGVSGSSGGSPVAGAAPGGGSMPSWQGAGDVGQAYLNFLTQKKLESQRQRTAYASPHSTPTSAPPQFSQLPQLQFALPRM